MSYLDQWKIRFLNINGGDLSDAEYFALKGYTSISRLKLLAPELGGSPEKYKEGFSMEYNPSLELGNAVHTHILQKDEFELSDYNKKPSGKLGYFVEKVYYYRKQNKSIQKSIDLASIDANYYKGKLSPKILKKALKEGIDYYFNLTNGTFTSDKEVIVLSKPLLDKAHECIKSIENSYPIQKILSSNNFEEKQYFNEIALFSDIEVTFPDGKTHIIKVKGKLDSVVWDPETEILYLNDIKTTSKQLEYFMDHVGNEQVYPGVFSHHFYFAQLALYSILLQKYFQEILHINNYTLQCNIFAVETCNQYRADVFRINNSYIDFGIDRVKDMLCRLAYHEVYGYEKQFPESI